MRSGLWNRVDDARTFLFSEVRYSPFGSRAPQSPACAGHAGAWSAEHDCQWHVRRGPSPAAVRPGLQRLQGRRAQLHCQSALRLGRNLCRVVEVIPPAVRTALAGPGATHGVPLDDFCDAVFAGLTESNAEEIGYGMTATEAFDGPKSLYRAMFKKFSTRFPVKTYRP